MNKFYIKEKSGNGYKLPWYSHVVLVWLVTFLFSIFVYCFILKLKIILYIEVLMLIAGLSWLIYKLYSNHGLFNYIRAVSIESKISNNLVKILSRERVRNYIQVPAVRVIIQKCLFYIKINKLVEMSDADIDVLRQVINVSLSKSYVVTSLRVNSTGKFYEFWVSKLDANQTFLPKRINDLVQKPYLLELQKDLVVNLADVPHIAVWGASGTGKTTVLFAIIAQCLSNGTDLYVIDGKMEFSSLAAFYPTEKIASDSSDVLSLLGSICNSIIPQRQRQVADFVKNSNSKKLGLRGYDFGLRPIIIVADEVGSIVASLDNKARKLFESYLTQIAQKGRSISVFLVVASQSPSTDVLSQGIRSQFGTKILLGQSNLENERMAFGQSISSGYVDKFTGYYFCNGFTLQPQKFWVPNLYEYDLANLEVFEKLYRLGKKRAIN